MEHRRGTFPAGRLFDIQIRVHWTLPVLVGLYVLVGMPGEPSEGLRGVILVQRLELALLIGLSVLLHELGHALTGRRLGAEPDCIVLWPLGGLAVQSGTPPSPWGTVIVYAAGPAVSALLSLLGFGLYLGLGLLTPGHTDAGFLLLSFCWLMGWCNLILLLFNLLPAFPLDGGGILRGILWARGGNQVRATLQCIHIARFVLLAVGVYAILKAQIFLVVVLLWLFFNGEMQRQAILAQGPIEEEGGFMGYDFSRGYRSLEDGGSTPRKPGWLERRRAQRELRRRVAEAERRTAMRDRVDELLGKVAREGREGLTREELRFLERASREYGNQS